MSTTSPCPSSSTLTGGPNPALPASVEQMLQRICAEQHQVPPDASVRRELDLLGEKASLDILTEISSRRVRKSLSGYILFLAKKARQGTGGNGNLSPSKRSAAVSISPSPSPVGSHSPNGFSSHSPMAKRTQFSPSPNSGTASIRENRPLLALCDLEFRKAFLILNYTGRRKLEEHMTVDDIMMLKDLPMRDFETKVWDAVGKDFINKEDRIQHLDWDSGKTHLYHCHVHQDGSYTFKGPYLGNTRTHLQRELGDDNVLIVKFMVEASDCTDKMVGSSYYDDAFNRIAKDGILIGLRRYRFFVFKDGGKEEKKKSQTSSSVKCFFVRFESLAPCEEREPYILANKSVYEARSLFMHANMVSTMAKYMARFSLILSATIKLQVDLASVDIERIEDIPCLDENECVVRDEEGDPLIHTDGTGFISEDLALKTPKDFSKAKYINDGNFERFLNHVNCVEKSQELKGSEAHTRDPVRLFYNGLAVKGTLLVNKKLQNKICIRPSMIKVEPDSRLINAQSFNSLEIVGISHKPRKAFLSKNLIALLSYGEVPKKVFLKILEDELKDSRSAYFEKPDIALQAALNRGEIDDDFTVARMILAGVPLDEPYLQYRLSELAKEERTALKGGRLPIRESFYLMGTTDPTGLLKSHEVCVILETGQISGDLLVYRNPGLHFGDVHRLQAVYVKELEEIIGNAKYGIFFSTKGKRSVANEIANGDFDGDMYWVSRNPELLENFKVRDPWRRIYSTPSVPSKKPNELSVEKLEHELFQLFKKTRLQRSNPMSLAANSWTAFMDRLLILEDGCAEETDRMKETMHQLVDTYYDALDAPKSGKKVVIPDEWKAEKFPHYMERTNSYRSTSVLGLIYDIVEKSSQSEDLPAKDVEVRKLPCFDVELPYDSWILWGERFKHYREEMSEAVKLKDKEARNAAANAVTNNYKQLLYHAPEFEESPRYVEEIYSDALAIYNVAYEHAEKVRDISKCRFAWRVAGPALLKLYVLKTVKNPFYCSPQVLRKLL